MTASKYDGPRYQEAYIGVNSIKGGLGTGYPCALEAFAIVVKGLPWENGLGSEEVLEIGHTGLSDKLDKWQKETGLMAVQPAAPTRAIA